MKEHYYINEFGQRVAVSEMRTEDIQRILADGRCTIIEDTGPEKESDVLARLRIELVIRAGAL